jgi:hypothetical protein
MLRNFLWPLFSVFIAGSIQVYANNSKGGYTKVKIDRGYILRMVLGYAMGVSFFFILDWIFD